MGDDVSSLSFGEVWFTFEEIWNYPMTAVRGLDWLDWEAYDVVVLPRADTMSTTMRKAKSAWIRDGGRLVTIGAACNLGLDDWGLSRYSDDGDRAERQDERDAHAAADRYAPYALSERNGIRSDIPGAVYQVDLDPPIPRLRLRRPLLEHQNLGRRYAHLEGGHNVGILGSEPAPVGGFAGVRASTRFGRA